MAFRPAAAEEILAGIFITCRDLLLNTSIKRLVPSERRNADNELYPQAFIKSEHPLGYFLPSQRNPQLPSAFPDLKINILYWIVSRYSFLKDVLLPKGLPLQCNCFKLFRWIYWCCLGIT